MTLAKDEAVDCSSWETVEPVYRELAHRDTPSVATFREWLDDVAALTCTVREFCNLGRIAHTRHTDDEAVGGLGLKFWGDPIFHGTAEVGYWLGRAHWGQGIMTRVLTAFVPWAFERFELNRIEAGVFETNPASGRVLEKAGFALEARLARSVTKDGRVLDRLLYVRFRE